ncbi:hypothetical protein HPB47_026414 [Ixodes persulcatus]|uniref:Uncharacterized protein n=1 Tax=Ixodes persulcatus TaxID=34615 RepID=A0AC60Q0T6_IXOPE|nr:hypothetical protein HPB47_026414 [Ixodes persulcatus]
MLGVAPSVLLAKLADSDNTSSSDDDDEGRVYEAKFAELFDAPCTVSKVKAYVSIVRTYSDKARRRSIHEPALGLAECAGDSIVEAGQRFTRFSLLTSIAELSFHRRGAAVTGGPRINNTAQPGSTAPDVIVRDDPAWRI